MSGLLPIVVEVVFGLLILALLLAFVRLVRGPSLPDRVVALDVIALVAVGLIATQQIATGEALLLDVALTVALIAFLGTVAFALYLGKRGGAR